MITKDNLKKVLELLNFKPDSRGGGILGVRA